MQEGVYVYIGRRDSLTHRNSTGHQEKLVCFLKLMELNDYFKVCLSNNPWLVGQKTLQ